MAEVVVNMPSFINENTKNVSSKNVPPTPQKLRGDVDGFAEQLAFLMHVLNTTPSLTGEKLARLMSRLNDPSNTDIAPPKK